MHQAIKEAQKLQQFKYKGNRVCHIIIRLLKLKDQEKRVKTAK